MEIDESKSQLLEDDNQIRTDISLSEAIGGFQRTVDAVLEAIDEDESFSELTAEKYSRKKSYLIEHLAELLHMHRVLFDHHVDLVEECSRKCPSLIRNHHLRLSDSMSPNVKSVIKENESGIITTQNADPETEKTMVIELQNQVDELKIVLANSNLKIKTMEDELEISRKELAADKDEISSFKGEQCRNLFQENQKLKDEIESNKEKLSLTRMKVDCKEENYRLLLMKQQLAFSNLTRRENIIEELNTKIDQCMSEISHVESALKSKEESEIRKLKDEITAKCVSLDDLKKSFRDSKLEKNRISDAVASLRADKCCQDRLTQDLQTRLESLTSEHRWVVSSFDNAREVEKELNLKIVEMEREVDRLMEVISDVTEEKMEVIRQLCSSMEHYMSRCNELSQLLAASKASCFDLSR